MRGGKPRREIAEQPLERLVPQEDAASMVGDDEAVGHAVDAVAKPRLAGLAALARSRRRTVPTANIGSGMPITATTRGVTTVTTSEAWSKPRGRSNACARSSARMRAADRQIAVTRSSGRLAK
jgi:hypothetical protein